MDTSKPIDKRNPREKANVVSVLFWWWTIPLFKKGYSKVLGPEDLYQPLKKDKSSALGDRLEKKWNEELMNAKKNNREPSLLKTIFRTFFVEYFTLGLYQIFNEFFLSLGTPLLLGYLLQYFKPEPTTTYETAMISAGGLCFAYIMETISFNYSYFLAFYLGGRIRISVCSVVYRKALRLSKTALGETAPGKVVNLVANDVNRFDLVSLFLHFMWSAPMLTIVVGVILYLKAGWAGVFGILAIFVVVPIQSYTGTLSSKYRLQTAIKTDERVRLMDEIISGVQVIKMYAWEKPFCALIALARKLELKVVRKSSYIRGIYMTFNLFTTRVALYCTMLAMIYSGENLTADKVFVFSSFFGILSFTMSGMFVRGFAEIAECMVAVRRLQKFLTYDEFELNVAKKNIFQTMMNGDGTKKDPSDDKNHDVEIHSSADGDSMHVRWVNGRNATSDENFAVKFDNVTAKWDENTSETTLEELNVTLEKGKFYMVIGMVGAGKSSFLSAILREINILSGEVKVNGKVSYADQEAWVFGASVRQNILFGQEFDRHRYQKVVKVCALLKDFEQFPQGDQTLVGERGSSLSGGQKARINLARAVYRQADVYLLDDPLSAVDAHVGKHLFEDCLQRYLKGKTRILATHQLQFLEGVDSIILLDEGRVRQYNDYHELLRDYPEYSGLIAAEKSGDASESSEFENSHLNRQVSTVSSKSRLSESSFMDEDDEEEQDDAKNPSNTIEGTSRGVIKGSILLKYLRVGSSVFYAILMVFLFLLTQLIVSLNDYFVNVFVTAEESRTYYEQLDNNVTVPSNSSIENSKILDRNEIYPQEVYILVSSIIVLSIFVVGIIRSFSFYSICLSSSQRLHDLIFSALIRASMRFFDTNPSGRVLNRFSKDMMALDEQLPKAMLDSAQIILMVFGSIFVAVTVNPFFLVPIGILVPIYYWIRKAYLKTSKNIKRLEGMTRSPVFTHLNATLNGLSTIRAYQAGKILEREFDNLQDTHTSSWFMFITTSSAFGFSLDMFNFSFTGLVIFSFLLLKDSFSGGQVGLAITQVMSLAGNIQFGMRQLSEVANQLMSVERVLEYTQVPPEPNLRDKGLLEKKLRIKQKDTFVDVPKDWPSRGFIEFKNVYMRYSDEDPPILKNLNLTIEPTEKVGIVGRTGAGKSSLISALFRIAKVEGAIEIDGIDTGTVALEDLRKSISIIPQLPVLFSGTLRRNLDPFEEYSDELLWKVLEDVELKDAVIGTGNGLDHRVNDRGSNYSVGQRQLICLARAILRNNRILMLDEATANVDPQTDALIQRTIRTKFAECTVLTVAHRLNTIMDSDKVLVMDKGHYVEFDHPHILLQNDYGHFTSLVKETGQAMYEQLCKVAKEAYLDKFYDVRL